MKNSLLWRFVVIIVVTVIAACTAWFVPPRLGIDLAGGVSQVYELDMTKLRGSSDSPQDVAGRVIEVLKKRIDPRGLKNIIWRVVGGKRIQIQMPLADKKTRDARDAQRAALEDLQQSVPKPSEIVAALSKRGPERDALLEKWAPKGSEQYERLEKLAAASDALDAAKKAIAAVPPPALPGEALLTQKYEAQKTFDALLQEVKSYNVDISLLQTLLAAADTPEDQSAQQSLADFPAKYPLQEKKIRAYIDAHKTLMELSGGGIDDPNELQRLITKAGVLDFRIAVQPGDIGAPASTDYQDALQSLQQHGPDQQVTVAGVKARWFAIDRAGRDNFAGGGYVVSNWAGEPYLLCYDDTGRNSHTLTHNDPDRKPWTVTVPSPPSVNSQGILSLPFRPDEIGAGYMGQLTSNYIHHPMAILLDDRAMTAPMIQSEISDSGEITFGRASPSHPGSAIQKEAEQLKEIMDAGSLPATLQSEPISVENISPDMGADNIAAGVRSAYIAVVAVMCFMFVYYTITGVFADLALMLNLVLVLASMATFRATFTLPGIAGLVLTLGMAVDANVLINERIREEIHKGASLWMAIKQGYDKVFWTIFDANLTCSLTSIVLIYVGSEEVKGFGVTLLIGLIIHMFTALFVTRTFMMAGVRWGVIRAIDDHSIAEYIREIFTFTWIRNGHWPFMRVITVSNIDWIGKRYIFWGISAVITIAGLVAFVARGEDKYDIEFRGGTQVTFQLNAPKPGQQALTIDEVRKRIEDLAALPGLSELRNARVYTVGDVKDRRFEMQTTIANTATVNITKAFLEPLADKFKDVLHIKPAVSVAMDNVDDLRELQDKGLIAPVTADTLDRVFEKVNVQGMPARDVTGYFGGVALVLENITPAQTAEELTQRIRSTETGPDFQNDPSRPFAVLPVMALGADGKSVAADDNDKRPLTKAVLVAIDTAHPYDEANQAVANVWLSRVAAPEWKLVRTSLSTQQLFDGVTSFDAVVADQAKVQALLAIVLSLVLIVVYVWVRFGGIWYGIGAILSLVHDAIVALAATVLSGVAYNYLFHKHPFLLITDFKINLTMIAAYLTIIGYSVNDTIVIFDRVRELRGKSHNPLTAKLINDAINQCFGRTIWTTFTVFIVVLIMYIWGGEGVRGFSFAMLVGVITGAYSTLAIASPMLLTTGAGVQKTGTSDENPFVRKELPTRPSLPQATS